MTLADWCLLGAVLLTLLTIVPAKARRRGAFDNARPRDPTFYAADPLSTRLLGAHQNGMEVFPFFAAGVLLAEFRHAPQAVVDELAVAFLLLRLAYVLAYAGDRPTLRSLLWAAGFFVNIAIFVLPALA
jgi:uncharacterized MAPEG superfamily protein